MNKGTHFNGQPIYGQLISLLDKHEILKFSREKKGERYVKHFDAYQHLVVMLYAVVSVSAMLPCPLLFIIIPLPPNQNQ